MSNISMDLIPDENKMEYYRMLRLIPINTRVELLGHLQAMARQFLEDEIRAAYPDKSEEDIWKEMIKLIVPSSQRKKVYGW